VLELLSDRPDQNGAHKAPPTKRVPPKRNPLL
jgi:hypothetical protein